MEHCLKWKVRITQSLTNRRFLLEVHICHRLTRHFLSSNFITELNYSIFIESGILNKGGEDYY